MTCPTDCMHVQHAYLPVKFGPEEVGVFLRKVEFAQIPSAGDYLSVLGQFARIENVLWKGYGVTVEFFFFPLPVEDPATAVAQLKAEGWTLVDQNGAPVQDTSEDNAAEPAETVAETETVV